MTIVVRQFSPDDAVAVAALWRACAAHAVTTPEVVTWLAGASAESWRYRLFVADADGAVVGAARTGIHAASAEPGHAFANLDVHPVHRKRGVGSALLAAAEEYLREVGAVAVHSWVADDPRSCAFAERYGYQRGRIAQFFRLDLTDRVPAVPGLPEGVELGTAADYLDDPHPLWEADVDATQDEPGDIPPAPMPYEDWRAIHWERPNFDRGLSSVVTVEGVVAAFTVAQTDGVGRYWSGMTGTTRAYRGRGLAKLAKADSLHRARAAGYTEAFTNNDATNAPMLAINTWLGYQPYATEVKYIRDLTGPAA